MSNSLSRLISADDLRVSSIERAETIPASWYTDSDILKLEIATVFERCWQLVGRADEVAKPGSIKQVDVAGNPILIVRDRDKTLRAFYGVCRHRGGPLRLCPTADHVLQCRYHGWTYRLDGTLRGVPRFDRAELFDKRDFGLVPVSVAVWEGLVFVNLDTMRESLESILEGITDRIAPIRLADLGFHAHVSYDVACNWKVYVDNYLEGYHLPYVHPELCDILDLKAYKTETFEHYSLQSSPIDASQNPYHVDSGGAFYYFVFPNIMLNILPGRLQTNVVEPVDADRCRVHFDYFYADGATEQRISDDLAYSDRVQQEDIEICERVQEGLRSIGYDRGRFSVECETGVWHFQSMLKEAFSEFV